MYCLDISPTNHFIVNPLCLRTTVHLVRGYA
jgi:hypothetical protein